MSRHGRNSAKRLYTKRMPIRLCFRHATSQRRLRSSGLMRSVKLSGTSALAISRQAPVSDRLRMMQSIEGALANEIEPPFNVRSRWLLRCSSIKRRAPASRQSLPVRSDHFPARPRYHATITSALTKAYVNLNTARLPYATLGQQRPAQSKRLARA
jgi:hypothetical protein